MTSTPTTTPDLGAIRARLATITPGEWCNAPHIAAVLTCDEADLICAEVEPQDAAFIAAAPADIRVLLKLHDDQTARIHQQEVALISKGDELRDALKRNAELQRDIDGYRDYADTLSKGLADLRDTALMITEENIGGVAGNPEEVIFEAKAQLIAAKARVQALEDALRDIGENYPPGVPDNQLDAVLATLAGVRRVARTALEGNK